MRELLRSKRIQQAVGIAVMLVIVILIASKGFCDVSMLLEEEPNDFWRALARYLLDNLAGGGGSWRGL